VRRILSPLSLVLALVVLAGCSDGDKSTPESGTPSAGPVKTMKHADAQALADKYRAEAVAALAATPTGPPTSSLAACEGPHTFTAITYGDVPVPAAQQPAALQKLRDHYTGEQYTVASTGADGSLNATAPDRVNISVAPEGTDTLRVNIATPCYSSDEPL
jgi:hypothetical protein